MSRMSLQGHILSVKLDSWVQVLEHLGRQSLDQVQIVKEGDHYVLSRPLPEEERGAYAYLYKRGGGKPTPPKGGPKGPKGPPPGGTPAGGRVSTYKTADALAA